MARVPFSVVPDVAPRTSVPDDYQHVQPAAAEGLAQFGQGATRAAQIFGQAAANDAFNQFQDGMTRILNGDPNKTVVGPDGQPASDTGYLGLKGRQALDARPQVQQQMDDLLSNIRGGLQTPEQRQLFDTYSRRYRANAMERIGSHADQQATTWYGEVNSASEKNAINQIAANPDNPNLVATGAADLINARVKQAQLAGAQKGDPVYQEALASGKRDALKAQVMALSVTDPAKALSTLEKNRDIAGADYAPLAKALQTKSVEAQGDSLGASAAKGAIEGHAAAYPYSNAAAPAYQQAVSVVPGGFSPAGLARLVQIESHGDPNASNASGHVGLTQFSQATWAEYGQGDRRDPEQSILAAQRYGAANARYLTSQIGRPPTDAELYLAHQQGPKGAMLLLKYPDAPAQSLVGLKAVVGNGGHEGMTAAQFVAMWTHKFNGTTPTGGPFVQGPPAPANLAQTAPEPQIPTVGTEDGLDASMLQPSMTPATPSPIPVEGTQTEQPATRMQEAPSPRAAAYSAVLNSDASPQVKARAITYLNEQFKAMQIAQDADTQARKETNDKVAGGYMSRIIKGDLANITQEIADDTRIDWQTKEHLVAAAEKHAQDMVGGEAAKFGPGFWQAYQQVTAQAGDPSRIADMGPLLRRAGPGGDLTLAGVEKLQQVMTAARKSPDQQAISGMQKATLDYVKHNLSFEADYGTYKIPDPKGMDIFNSRAIPAFWKAYEDGISAGKTPFQLLSRDSPDFVGDRVIAAYKRSDAQEMRDRIASGETVANQPGENAPPKAESFKLDTPEGVVSAFKAGSISRADAESRLNAMRSRLTNPVPNQ